MYMNCTISGMIKVKLIKNLNKLNYTEKSSLLCRIHLNSKSWGAVNDCGEIQREMLNIQRQTKHEKDIKGRENGR